MIKPSNMTCQVIIRRMSSSKGTSDNKSLQYCVNLVQKRTYEQYIATLILPPKIRRCGFAIRAFNIEISSIRDQITTRNAGLGRSVFWQDLVKKIFEDGKVPNHPVGKELHYVIKNVSSKQKYHREEISMRSTYYYFLYFCF